MIKKKFLIQSIIVILTIIGIAYGRLVSVPDASSKIYGIPLNWAFINW